MKRFSTYFLLFIASLASAVGNASAAPATVKAKLDSVQILMGRITMLRLEVVQNANARGEFEIFRSMPPSGVVGVCGDSVELRTSFERDTTELGSGRIQINYAVPVQAFDSGFYRLPQLRYIIGKDTVYSNQVALKVLPVTGVTADSKISGYADVMGPADPSIFDFLPNWLYRYWWLILLALAVIAGVIYLVYRYRTKGTLLAPKPKPSPYAVAIKGMENLKKRQLWENGLEREYFTELTEILRQYLDGRFGINAMEMTTRQIIEHLSKDERIRDKKEYVRQVLDMADFVKFAAQRTIADDNVTAYDNVLRFIEETKPTPEEIEAEKQKQQRIDDGFEIAEEKPSSASKKSSGKSKKLKKGGKK